MINPVILCGGSGTRLWPLSTPKNPKQFLALTSTNSMIKETADRFNHSYNPAIRFEDLLVIGSSRHRANLELTFPNALKILEPMARNSAPAVAAACLALGEDALILILPADHSIENVAAFHEAIGKAAEAASADAIVTFGISPSHPATGYGYIRAASEPGFPVLSVEKFVEKPNLETAKSYLDDGNYFWNAGIFLFKSKVMMAALEMYAPKILNEVKHSMQAPQKGIIELNSYSFSNVPSISIDYAVMEHATNVKTVPVDMGWSDVGGYRALYDLLSADDGDNVTEGPVQTIDSRGLYVRSEGPSIAISGVSNLVVVATESDVLITPKHEDGAAKTLGTIIETHRHALGLSAELRETVQQWLATAYDTWAKVGWDEKHGGFVEQLRIDGTPDRDAARRVRVQARQVFSFSKAIDLGWPKPDLARSIVEKGLRYIDTQLRHPDGGFFHIVGPNGKPIDEQRDLYDHAFMILAGAAAYKAFGSETGLRIATEALSYVDSELRDHQNGGWFESSELPNSRRSNPHMHMLEALMELHSATGNAAAMEHAREIILLFETHFFEPSHDVLAEDFSISWSKSTTQASIGWEPGHHYEWASLLQEFQRLTGHDSASWRHRLIQKANRSGRSKHTEFAINKAQANGTIIDANSRLWHQLEMFRAWNIHPNIASKANSERLLNRIMTDYLLKGPNGGWVDELSPSGDPISEMVPASMLYHLVTALGSFIAPSNS